MKSWRGFELSLSLKVNTHLESPTTLYTCIQSGMKMIHNGPNKSEDFPHVRVEDAVCMKHM